MLRAARASGQLPLGATRVLAAWLGHLRGSGAPIRDVRASELGRLAAGTLEQAARNVLGALDAEAGADGPVVAAVAEQCAELEAASA